MPLIQHPTIVGGSPGRQAGFSITELLIAAGIGVFVVLGVVGVLTATRDATRFAQQTDTRQEGLRYIAQTLTRVVRDGGGFTGTTGTQLVVTFPGTLPDEVNDCLGQPANTAVSNTFTVAQSARTGRYELLCQQGTQGAQSQPLVEGLAATNPFVVELLKPSANTSTLGTLVAAANATEATSVRITVRMQPPDGGSAQPVRFVATMRCKLFGSCG
jgi:Tfp pilus assembly protein PilW